MTTQADRLLFQISTGRQNEVKSEAVLTGCREKSKFHFVLTKMFSEMIEIEYVQ